MGRERERGRENWMKEGREREGKRELDGRGKENWMKEERKERKGELNERGKRERGKRNWMKEGRIGAKGE